MTEQTIMIDNLVISGQNPNAARALLAILEGTPLQWYAHRPEIQEEIERIKAGLV